MSRSRGGPEAEPAALLLEIWRQTAGPAAWSTGGSYTGKAFARLSGPDGQLCLRRLPFGASPLWLGAIHGAVAHLREHGCPLFPGFIPTDSGQTVVRHGGRIYDLAAWAAGEAPGPVEGLTSGQLASLGAGVARLHEAGLGTAGPPARSDWLTREQAVTQRLAWDPVPRGKDSWHHLAALAAFFEPLALPDAPTLGDGGARAVVEAAGLGLRWLAEQPAGADLAAEHPTLTHGDLWADHVRFAGAELGALIATETLALRPPAGDLAALCADFGLWEVGRCARILAGYAGVRPVAAELVAVLPGLGMRRTLGVLRERLRGWLDSARRGEPEAFLGGPVPYWCGQIRTLAALEPGAFARQSPGPRET